MKVHIACPSISGDTYALKLDLRNGAIGSKLQRTVYMVPPPDYEYEIEPPFPILPFDINENATQSLVPQFAPVPTSRQVPDLCLGIHYRVGQHGKEGETTRSRIDFAPLQQNKYQFIIMVEVSTTSSNYVSLINWHGNQNYISSPLYNGGENTVSITVSVPEIGPFTDEAKYFLLIDQLSISETDCQGQLLRLNRFNN